MVILANMEVPEVLTLNQRGTALINMLKSFNLISLNSQECCDGPIETFFARQGELLSTTDHVFIKEDDVHRIQYCYMDE